MPLDLSNSLVYYLRDNKGNIFYVGSTTKSARRRYKGHLSDAHKNKHRAVSQYIRQLNYKFFIQIKCYFPCSHLSQLLDVEKYFINRQILKGRTLYNVIHTALIHCQCGIPYYPAYESKHLDSKDHLNHIALLESQETSNLSNNLIQQIINIPRPIYQNTPSFIS